MVYLIKNSPPISKFGLKKPSTLLFSSCNQLSHLRYREGAISYLDVIDSDRTILQQEQLAAQLKGSQINKSNQFNPCWGRLN